jgi:hypothetical protein
VFKYHTRQLQPFISSFFLREISETFTVRFILLYFVLFYINVFDRQNWVFSLNIGFNVYHELWIARFLLGTYANSF